MLSKQALIVAVRELLAERLLIKVDAPDTDLVETGLVDSIGLVELILELEQRFAIMLPTEELELDDLRSIERISELINRRTLRPVQTPSTA
jgi:acyl carrier protein